MPHVREVADRIHIHRLGKSLTVIDPKKYSMSAMAVPDGETMHWGHSLTRPALHRHSLN